MIDYYKDRNPIGNVFNAKLGCVSEFFGITTLLKLIDEIISPMYEVSENTRRYFVKKEDDFLWDNATPFEFNLKESRGHIATFKIDILFTQRKSWQGVIKWIEKDEQLCFRSVYELIELIDNVAFKPIGVKQHCYNKTT